MLISNAEKGRSDYGGRSAAQAAIERSTTMETLLQAYADKFFERDAGDYRLTFRGEVIQSSATPESLGLHGMEEIKVVLSYCIPQPIYWLISFASSTLEPIRITF